MNKIKAVAVKAKKELDASKKEVRWAFVETSRLEMLVCYPEYNILI